MNATEVELGSRVGVEQQARIVCGLLKEYVAKLTELNAEILAHTNTGDYYLFVNNPQRAAWLIDRGELLRKPLTQLLSRGSSLLEHASLDPLTESELILRMREIEIALHHALRLTHELRQRLEKEKVMDQVSKFRLAAGLSAMKGGPLNPE